MKNKLLIPALLIFSIVSKCARAADAYDSTANKTEVASLSLDWQDAARDREVPVKIYYPKNPTGKLPVIIFSHGLGGSRAGYSYLGESWASHGYISIHLTHRGTDTQALLEAGVAHMAEQMKKIISDPMQAVDRCKDVGFAIDQLEGLNANDKLPLKGHIDVDKVGMAGHSYGGNTTMLTSGEVSRSGRSWADPRIKCAIAMSPPVAVPERLYDRTWAQINIPLFVMTGTKDDSPVGETKAAQRRIPYDHLALAPAYLLILNGGDHMVFSGRRQQESDEAFEQLITQGSLAFWDAYLRDNAAAKAWLKEGGYAKVLGDQATLELKN
jgi:predicted dienelactone hydrolase